MPQTFGEAPRVSRCLLVETPGRAAYLRRSKNQGDPLEKSLAQEQPTSAFHIAIGLGYSVLVPVNKFPDLCRAIGEKIALNRTMQLSSIRQALLRAVLEEDPPT